MAKGKYKTKARLCAVSACGYEMSGKRGKAEGGLFDGEGEGGREKEGGQGEGGCRERKGDVEQGLVGG